MADYDSTGVRATMLRGGTSRGLYFEPGDLPADPAARDDLLLRLMGTPDPRQIDGLGGATSLTSKVAVVGPSEHPDADVDYLFLQLGVDEADGQRPAELRQHPRRRRARSPSSAGWCPRERRRDQRPHPHGQLRQHRRRHLPDARRSGRVPRRRRHRRACPARPRRSCSRSPTPRARRRAACCPPATCGTPIDGIEVTCVDNGMPVVLAMAESFGLTRRRVPRGARRATRPCSNGSTPSAARPASSWASATCPRRRCPRRRCSPRPATAARSCTRSFIPVQPHTAIGVLAAVSVVTGMLLPGAVGHELTADWPRDRSQVDVEHPTGHLLVDVVVDADATPPRVVRSARRPHRPQALRRHRLPRAA